MRRAPVLRLGPRDRSELRALVQSRSTPARVRVRAHIVLLAASGETDLAISRRLGVSAPMAARWRHRFLRQGVHGVTVDAPRSGRPPVIPETKIQVVVRSTIGRRPVGANFWSTRSMAREVGLSKSTVHRIWRSRRIDPRRAEATYRPDPGLRFFDRVTDMVGVYLNLPERAIAFSTDERATGGQLRAGDRGALGRARERSVGAEFRAFLQTVDRETPRTLEVHVLVDNRLFPSTPELQRWLVRKPRVHLHFLPADPAGRSPIDRLVTEFSRKRPDGGGLPAARRLREAIREHLRSTAFSSRPFIWAAPAHEIRGRFGAPELTHRINGTPSPDG